MAKPLTMLHSTPLHIEYEWGAKEPETVEDCAMRLDMMHDAYDLEYAHVEADRLLLKALTLLCKTDTDRAAVQELQASFYNLRKLYA